MERDKSHGHGVSAKFAMQAPLLSPVFPPCHPERSRSVSGERSAILFDERRFFGCPQNDNRQRSAPDLTCRTAFKSAAGAGLRPRAITAK